MNKLNKLYDLGSQDSIDVQSLKSAAKKIAKFSPALLLAGVVPAEAQIICNDDAAPITLTQGTFSSPNATYLDIDSDGNADFGIRNQTSFYGYGGAIYLGANPYASNMFVNSLTASSYYEPANLPAGSLIGPTLASGQSFGSGNFGTIANEYIGWGNFNPPSNGYVGIKFESAAGLHYGWIELSTEGSDVTIEGFCYESTPDTPIATGQRFIEIVPTLGEWGLISLNLLLMIFGVVAVREKGRIAIKQKA